jgi:hypothetical protein
MRQVISGNDIRYALDTGVLHGKGNQTIELPSAFDAENEQIKFLQGLKKKAAKSFSLTRMDSLYATHALAYALYVFGRVDECIEVCVTAARVEFSGNFNIWSPVETTLALYARILGEKGDKGVANAVMERVRSAGFKETRLDGLLLKDKEIKDAVAEGSKTDERDWRMNQMSELCFMKELGGSQACPVDAIEKLFMENLTALRALLKVA